MAIALPNTTFCDELRVFIDNLTDISNTKYIGNCVYANINKDIRLKVAFQTGANSGTYDRIRLTAINKTRGEIDHVDIFMPLTKTPYGSTCRKYLSLSASDNRLSWYSKLINAEIASIRIQIAEYAQTFK